MGRLNRFGVDIVSARTPRELAETVRNGAPEVATVPVIRDDAKVFPVAVPPPPVTRRSAPAEFPTYEIRTEEIAKPIPKDVPGMYDQGTLVSLFPSLVSAAPVPPVTRVRPNAESLPPPAPVKEIFNTEATRKIDQAIEMDYAASRQRNTAQELQRKADEAAYLAAKANAQATMNPEFDVQAEAVATAARADDAQYVADRAHEKAAAIDQAADEKVVQANRATQQLVEAEAREQVLYETSVAQADETSLVDALTTPGMVPPEMFEPVSVPGFSVSPMIAAGVAGVLGFLLGGARGGAVGAVLGGGGAYFMGQRSSSGFVQAAPNPIDVGFSPYQEQDGTWIMSEADQQAYYNSHYLR